MNGCRIAIMAKAPLAGLAKTRLAPALGPAGAAALAERLLDHAVAEAARADLGAVTLWASPACSHPAFERARRQHGVQLAVQGEGDLGARMSDVVGQSFAQEPGPLLLMGTDAPALDASVLRRAAQTLHEQALVFVPALDGGYALLGLRAATPALRELLFAGMRWSTPQVMALTRERLARAGLAWAELPALADIDEPADLVHLPPGWLAQPAPAGRSCPLHYRYAPAVFAGAAPTRCETLYVVGGLYGNEPALAQVLALFAHEPGDKRLLFNGDFHWFDVDPAAFERVQRAVLGHTALRGNVETELAGADAGAGCGCAYPASVGDEVVERSNRIAQRLRDTASRRPALGRELGALPMWARVDVGALRVAAVHGDAQSLAGWGFAQEQLRDAGHRARVRRWFDEAQVDAFASSHTCLPVYLRLPKSTRALAPLVLNNGATGLPNFRGDSAGLVTRISLRPFEGEAAARRDGRRAGAAFIDVIAVDAATAQWRAQFLRQWPDGSDAHASYWQRIAQGPDFDPAQALRW